jgi:hypothetical protein
VVRGGRYASQHDRGHVIRAVADLELLERMGQRPDDLGRGEVTTSIENGLQALCPVALAVVPERVRHTVGVDDELVLRPEVEYDVAPLDAVERPQQRTEHTDLTRPAGVIWMGSG